MDIKGKGIEILSDCEMPFSFERMAEMAMDGEITRINHVVKGKSKVYYEMMGKYYYVEFAEPHEVVVERMNLVREYTLYSHRLRTFPPNEDAVY